MFGFLASALMKMLVRENDRFVARVKELLATGRTRS
jgi:hypothetical protein